MNIHEIIDHMYDEYEGAKTYLEYAKEEKDSTKKKELAQLALDELKHFEVMNEYFEEICKKEDAHQSSEIIKAFHAHLIKKVMKVKTAISAL